MASHPPPSTPSATTDPNIGIIGDDGNKEKHTNIWETRLELQEHPLLQVAISIVIENIENCFVSTPNYCDATNQHMSVFKSLPGKFYLKKLDYILGQTTTHEHNLGIAFNQALINHSTEYVRNKLMGSNHDYGISTTTVDKLHNDINVLQFVALIQQSLEQELGHLKFHVEGVPPKNSDKPNEELEVSTPEEQRFEAGYAMLSDLRKGSFQSEFDDEKLVLIDLDGPVCGLHVETCRSYLYANQKARNRQEGLDQLDVDDDNLVKPLDKDEILSLMDYPKVCNKKRKRDDDSPGSPPGNKPSKGDGDDDDDESPLTSSGRVPRPWQESIQYFLPEALNRAQFQSSLPLLRQSESYSLSRHAGGKVTDEKIAAFQNCHFKLKLCDRSKRETSQFYTGDQICVLMTVANTTPDPVVFYLTAGIYFGECGLIVEIDDLKRSRVVNHYIHRMILPAGEDFSCFRILTKPVKDGEVGYDTPPVGEYSAIMSVFGKRVGNPISFSVIDHE